MSKRILQGFLDGLGQPHARVVGLLNRGLQKWDQKQVNCGRSGRWHSFCHCCGERHDTWGGSRYKLRAYDVEVHVDLAGRVDLIICGDCLEIFKSVVARKPFAYSAAGAIPLPPTEAIELVHQDLDYLCGRYEVTL